MRRLTDQEGQMLQQIVRRGSTYSVRYRRANVSAHKGADIRRRATKNKVELCFTIATSNHPNHTVQTRNLHACLRWGGRSLKAA
ncbi:hypothetical protein ACFC8N_25375 [Streptomyces sp. NPDC055966]|uniref:hypothetical protein n=1 Tax=Streptomyces sp. NPDC055966 TaxID=3345669 RepID=UPI0035DB58CF